MSVKLYQAFKSGEIYSRSFGKPWAALALMFILTVLSVPILAQEAEPELPPEEQAKKHFNRALELKDSAAIDQLKATEMLAEYDLCLKLDPNFVDAYTNLGVHHFSKKNYAQAEKNFKKASELDATDTTVFDNLGKTYTALHKYPEAQKAFEAGVSANAEYAGGQKELGKLLYKQKKYKEAVSWLDKYNGKVTDDHFAHYLAGKSHKNLKDNASALKEFRVALKIKKNYANAHNGMGQIYLAQEKFAKAIAAYRKSVKYNPKGYRAFYNLAIAIQSNNPDDLKASIAAWKQALKVAKKIPKAKDIAKTAASQIKELEKQKTNKDMNN